MGVFNLFFMQSSYQNLKVWQKSTDLVIEIYQITKNFPKEEIYGITSQIRRCAVSIPSNIAEGSQRSTQKDFKHFLFITKGSAAELETQLLIANKLEYIDKDIFDKLKLDLIEIRKMLSGLMSRLQTPLS